MTDIHQDSTPSSTQPHGTPIRDSALTEAQQEAKTHAIVAYVFMVLGLITGIFWLVGAIWAMVKKSDARGTPFEDHYANIIKTFWIGLVVSIISIPLAVILIGYITLFAIWIWSIYRIVKGVARLSANQPYYS
ncbi:DUF4870 family protein [Salinimonas iocasae]|uniref:Yip1 domain-containing protein n=1 Tax=Salinimonas iocasae TaxID=2572577 RepID=A0A5B7YGP7_9ALTE|nr:YIP1 family protein [Salinimonas iocasae]QCZ94708.1 hypothetical protein FBQ74_15080 [Salinimonas iocasae]